MQALVISPGRRGSARIATVPEPRPVAGAIRIRTLEVGVCGTDREIVAGEFGVAPAGETELILGHELLGVVEQDGDGFAAGQLVTATVRRSCEHCAACHAGSPDSCDTGEYSERGITALDGFAGEVVVELPEHLVAVAPALGRAAVLAEPASVCARALRHTMAIGTRHVWEPQRALVVGAGAVGMLSTYLLRLEGHQVWTASREGAGSLKARLVEAAGGTYVSSASTASLLDLRDEVGGFDVVVEAAGDAEVMLRTLALLRRNGVACLLGIDARERPVSIPGPVVGVDAVVQNRVVFGSVNATKADWHTAVTQLEAMRRRWPEALDQMVGLRVSPERFEEAFAFQGVKATLRFG